MSTFEERWKKMVEANPPLADGTIKMTMTVEAFRKHSAVMYAKGSADEAEKSKSSLGLFDSIFGSLKR